MSYTYDMAGVRSSKTVNGTTYSYTTLSGLVVRQEWDGNSIDFIYDESNQPYLMRYKAAGSNTYTTYYYVVNLQGDVVGLMNSSGTLVALYEYDPWGMHLLACLKTTTDAPDIYKQRGTSCQTGGSVSIGDVSAGMEYLMFKDTSSNQVFQGYTFLAGVGSPIPIEFHGEVGYSYVIGINIFDIAEKACDNIMEW